MTRFIAAPPATVHAYVCHLQNLDHWTLGGRMVERVDDSTWIGTAPGYQRLLYYHVRPLESPRFLGIEWQCGYEYRNNFKYYPVLLLPADYVESGSAEPGTCLHWVSVIDPAQRTPMIMQGIQTVRNSEVRALKAALEGEAGRSEAAHSQYRVDIDTIYIGAPLDMMANFVGDLRPMPRWSHLLKPVGDVERKRGSFLDEYRQNVDVTLRTNRLEDYVLVEQDYVHPRFGTMQRSPTLLIPLAHAFGDPSIPG